MVYNVYWFAQNQKSEFGISYEGNGLIGMLNSNKQSTYYYMGERLNHEVTLSDGKLYIVASNLTGNSYSFWLVSTGGKTIYMSKLAASADEIMELSDSGEYHLSIKLKSYWQALSVVRL